MVDGVVSKTVSSLSIRSRYPGRLGVVGELPHGADMEPATLNDARKLIDWLNLWVQLQPDEGEDL
jgi:hypothetical protein